MPSVCMQKPLGQRGGVTPLPHIRIHAGTSVAVPKAAELGSSGHTLRKPETLSWCQPLLLLSDLPVGFKGQTAKLA